MRSPGPNHSEASLSGPSIPRGLIRAHRLDGLVIYHCQRVHGPSGRLGKADLYAGALLRIPNNISVWVQTPVYFILAFAEILGFATLSEYSYSKAPKDMRSLVQALRQVTAGVGSTLGMALSPVAVDPKVMYMYTGLAATVIAAAPVFWVAFRSYDKIDDELNETGVMQSDSNQDEMEETTANACL